MLIFWMTLSVNTFSQNNCNPTTTVDSFTYEGTAYFNYGSIARSKNQKYRHASSIGQTFVGFTENAGNNSNLGFFSRYLLPPFALQVNATQGDLLDRIQLSWTVDGFGPSPNEGFNIYRDGIFLATVGPNIRNYNDFNVIAGVAYQYDVRGLNSYGEGNSSLALGFQVPNGVVTGWIKTQSGSPVPNALVTLMPMQGFSAQFDEMDEAVAALNGDSTFIPPNEDWTMTFYIKTDSSSNKGKVISVGEILLYIRAINSASGEEGIEVASLPDAPPILTAVFEDSIKNEWNHVALTYEEVTSLLKLYINGVLIAQTLFNDNTSQGEGITSEIFFKLGNTGYTGGWKGNIDELRIYDILLNELDFPEIMHGTASSQTEGLTFYWKMDEELGEKSYDLKNRIKLFFCGAEFDEDRPPVRTAGKTNASGYYRIESASYGTGTTFLAEPMKSFYLHKSVKFNRSQNTNISIPNFPLPKKSTIELWVNNAGATGLQTIVSKKSTTNDFKVFLEPSGINQVLKISLNGSTHSFGNLGNGFQHLAITIDSTNNGVQVYKNGTSVGSHTFSGTLGNLAESNSVWRLGVHNNGTTLTDYYNGLIDEFAVYDTILTSAQILNHYEEPRDMQARHLYVYYPMNEGAGDIISNVGSNFLTNGTLYNYEWSSFAPNQIEEPHIFLPETRQVTLNPSVTSVDQVDFTDRSTIPVVGYIRYQNTDCFAPNVEILVNNQPYSPRIFTDSTGKFIIDFDPGFTGTLKPVFEDHLFTPFDWKITNISNPIAGILFNDLTTRTISGQIAGGGITCRKSIIETTDLVKVILNSVDGCFRKEVPILDQDGFFEIDNLPALEKMTVAVIHTNPVIDIYFNDKGFPTVDISKKDTTHNFFYFAQPEIEVISGLDPFSPNCDVIVMDQFEVKTLGIKLKEQYVEVGTDLGVCYIDSANFRIINGFGDETIDTTMGGGILNYEFRVGKPNPSIPYEKSIQIISTTLEGNKGEYLRKGIVTGIFNKLPTFTTQLPVTPTMVLHDPPGDGSYAFIEKGQKICENITMVVDSASGGGAQTFYDFGIDMEQIPFFGIPKIDVESDIGPNITAINGVRRVSSNTMEICNTFNTRISTSENDLIVGAQGGDVFIGTGLNINFGFADIILFDANSCGAYDSLAALIQPSGYHTTFIYSEWHILNAVIPHLKTLKSLPGTSPEDTTRFHTSIERWNQILDDNKNRIASADRIDNLSFSAGVTYEFSETIDTLKSTSSSDGKEFKGNFDFSIVAKAQGIGGGAILKAYTEKATTQSEDSKNEKGITTGYVLKDDDELDAFSVDICVDSVYKTPIFKVKAGQSSCPWEPNTAKREGVDLVCTNGPNRTDVPANEAATFTFNLGNTSSTLETWTYAFTAGPESNPDGAKIFCNGAPMNQIQWYAIPYGTIIPVTVTVEKGSVEYDYDSLEIVLYSACEDQRANDLGILPDSAEFLYSAVYVSAHFIRPCSEVNIYRPQQDWVVKPSTGSDLRIDINGYNTDPKFRLIRAQYRKTNGDGTWININLGDGSHEKYNPQWEGLEDLPVRPDTLSRNRYDSFFWNTESLEDGEYEIRTVSECTGDANDKPGYSEIIKGKIDRQPPALLGVPQPSDGVYHVGDEISFTFNQSINCNKFMQLQILGSTLKDAVTDSVISITRSCVDNKIVLVPEFNNEEFENKILKAELFNVQDLTGNINPHEQWEFYVDRNELAWLTDSIELVKYVDETKTISAKIHNRGGYPVPFTINNIPDWLHVFPDRGTLVANEIQEIHFTVNNELDLGEIDDDIILRTETGVNPFFMGGDEPLNIKARNLCRPESWVLNPNGFNTADYSYSMNFIVQLNIEGTLSVDENDIVGAYVDGQLRGIAKIEYQSSLNKYLAFLSVYSNAEPGDPIEQIQFQIWDASDCKLYAYAIETFNFAIDDVKGTLSNCIILHTNTTLLRKIFLNPGWNWISMNLDLVPNDINSALSSLSNPSGAFIKSQETISGYSNMANSWIGGLGLSTLEPVNLYQYRSQVKDSLSIIGNYIDPTTTPIPLDSGWNWIGYLPTQSLKVDDALATVNATNGAILKSQLHFAQYLSGQGWIGNLKTMNAPNGYLLLLREDATLTYPDPLDFRSEIESGSRNVIVPNYTGLTEVSATPQGELPFANWQVDPTKYEYSMNAIAIVVESEAGNNLLHDGDEVAAFVNNEVRGSGKSIFIPALNSYIIFMTMYANVDGENMTLKYFDSSANKEYALQESVNFRINSILGQVDAPEHLHLNGTTSVNEIGYDAKLIMYPNPFANTLHLQYHLNRSQEVTITINDAYGKLVESKKYNAKAGSNNFDWKPIAGLSGGTYLVTVESEEGTYSNKVLYIK